jgi:hypothetical protein
MVVKLFWSRRADQGYARIIKHLEKEWTDKEVTHLRSGDYHFFNLLKENPRILEPTSSHKNLYRGPINRLTIVTYHYKPRRKKSR